MAAIKNSPIIDWLEIESSAPGKCIISGEYSVIWERQAIAAAIDLRTKVTIRPNKEGKVRLNLKNLDSVREWPISALTSCRLVLRYSECLDYKATMPEKLSHLLHARYNVNSQAKQQQQQSASTSRQSEEQSTDTEQQTSSKQQEEDKSKQVDKRIEDATIAFLLLYIGLGDSYCNSARPAIDVEVESTLPIGSGLGSSSALSVALCGALMRVFRVAAEKHIISMWAFNIDKYFHGKPSGVDNSTVTFGDFVLFQNGKVKSIAKSGHSMKVLLVDTGVTRSTRTLCEMVMARSRETPTQIDNLLTSINDITTQIWRRLCETNCNPRSIASLIQANQECLDLLGVGHEKLTEICTIAKQLDFRAKQTGAGGGGSAIILYDETDNQNSVDNLRKELEKSGYSVQDHAVGCEGLTVKIKEDPDKKFPLDS